MDAVTQLKKLADAIAANGESNLLPPKPEDFGKMTNAVHPGTAQIMILDAMKADQFRAQGRIEAEEARKRAHDAQMKRH